MLKNINHLPSIRFDCGKEDSLIEENRKLHQNLLHHGIDHIYEEFGGGHNWDYWGKNIVETLLFFNRLI